MNNKQKALSSDEQTLKDLMEAADLIEILQRLTSQEIQRLQTAASNEFQRLWNALASANLRLAELELERVRLRQLAEMVASFLYWSSWLGNADVGNVHAVEIITHDGQRHDCGTQTFVRLKDMLDETCPDWRSWNSNYTQQHEDM